jgi:redox-sensitive bicupin YhaK (pirin superfamily)
VKDLAIPPATPSRGVIERTRGTAHGPIVRLMSPSDLGAQLKPFVFLDRIETDAAFIGSMPLHPHSGIATVTLFNEGNVRFDVRDSGQGLIDYGGLEWMRAGMGVWHGKELSAGTSARVQGYQLWIALPPELESAPSESQYLESKTTPQVGPARLILGAYENARSPVRSPPGINYLLVTLAAGDRWEYRPPTLQNVLWLSVSRGELVLPEPIDCGELAIFERGGAAVTFQASSGQACVFVVGSAIAHPYDLKLGRYSVHTSDRALKAGEANIAEIARHLRASAAQPTAPVFK